MYACVPSQWLTPLGLMKVSFTPRAGSEAPSQFPGPRLLRETYMVRYSLSFIGHKAANLLASFLRRPRSSHQKMKLSPRMTAQGNYTRWYLCSPSQSVLCVAAEPPKRRTRYRQPSKFARQDGSLEQFTPLRPLPTLRVCLRDT